MKKPKCNKNNCKKEATRILRKRVGISIYCDEHYAEIMLKRKLKGGNINEERK